MSKIILGYANNHGLDTITKEDALMLTHINVAFGVIRGGLLSMHGLPNFGARIQKIREMNPAIKIVLSIGGWGAGGFSNMALTAEGRAAFVQSVKEVMNTYALDGVDIDWEYPCNNSAEIDADPQDKYTFTALMQELKDMAGDKIVSIAAGGSQRFIDDTQMDQLGKILDYVQIMSYDLRSGFCKQAGHHTAPFASVGDESGRDMKTLVELFTKAGVPKGRIVVGAAFYARRWEGVQDINHGLFQPAGSIGFGGPDYGELVEKYIDKNGFVRYWDEAAKAPWLYGNGQLISYDDPESLAAKCAYVLKEDLLGIMYWEHGCDTTHTLLKALYDGIHKN